MTKNTGFVEQAVTGLSTPSRPRAAPPLPATVTAEIVGLDEGGRPLLKFDDSSDVRAAASTVPIHVAEIGKTAAVVYADGDSRRPIVIGVLQTGFADMRAAGDPIGVSLDGESRLVMSSQREIVLRCGKASLTLRADGTVVMRGLNISSNASAQQRIRGASVKIN